MDYDSLSESNLNDKPVSHESVATHAASSTKTNQMPPVLAFTGKYETYPQSAERDLTEFKTSRCNAHVAYALHCKKIVQAAAT